MRAACARGRPRSPRPQDGRPRRRAKKVHGKRAIAVFPWHPLPRTVALAVAAQEDELDASDKHAGRIALRPACRPFRLITAVTAPWDMCVGRRAGDGLSRRPLVDWRAPSWPTSRRFGRKPAWLNQVVPFINALTGDLRPPPPRGHGPEARNPANDMTGRAACRAVRRVREGNPAGQAGRRRRCRAGRVCRPLPPTSVHGPAVRGGAVAQTIAVDECDGDQTPRGAPQVPLDMQDGHAAAHELYFRTWHPPSAAWCRALHHPSQLTPRAAGAGPRPPKRRLEARGAPDRARRG